MRSNEDYTNMTLEDLLSEQKKIKSRKNTTAGFIGFLIGVAIYAATHQGFILTIILFVFAFWIGRENAQKLKNLQEEISRRDAVG